MTREEILEQLHAVRTAAFKDRIDDLNALRAAYGDGVIEIVLQARAAKMKKAWAGIARQHGRNDIQGLKETLWTWVGEAGFEFTSEETAAGTQFKVSRCPLADMAKSLGAADWGFACYCADDPHIAAGFNADLGFKRSKTLMEGHDCCDHFYYLKSAQKT